MSRRLRIGFIVLMLALTGLFAWLGTWQVQRLAEKEALIASVAAGLESPAVPLETLHANIDYRPVTFSGSYVPGAEVLVFTSLSEPKGQFAGPGYWVMSPLALDEGGTVFVNRGFVPQARREEIAPAPEGHQELTGLARQAESPGSFTPEPDVAGGIDWVRNPQRLGALAGDLPQPVLPWFIDLPAGPPGTLPQGGETVVEFPNNHLGYAITWYGFAILTPILLAFWLVRQRPAKGAKE